jgi:hypothetical protein
LPIEVEAAVGRRPAAIIQREIDYRERRRPSFGGFVASYILLYISKSHTNKLL